MSLLAAPRSLREEAHFSITNWQPILRLFSKRSTRNSLVKVALGLPYKSPTLMAPALARLLAAASGEYPNSSMAAFTRVESRTFRLPSMNRDTVIGDTPG